MNALKRLTETAIRGAANREVFERGLAYFHEDAVLSVVLRESILRAQVQGSEFEPYQVVVQEDAQGALAATCTCPFNWDGLCKHSVAVLLTYLHKPEEIRERPSLKSQLEPLEQERLLTILLHLADTRPELTELIEELATAPVATKEGGRAPAIPAICPAELKQAQAAVRSAVRSGGYDYSYRNDGRPNVAREIEAVANRARPYLDAEDGPSALALLETIVEELASNEDMLYDEDGETYELSQTLGALLAEALLTSVLTPDERQVWKDKVRGWQRSTSDDGLSEGLDIAAQAAHEGWDHAGMAQVLAGESTALEPSTAADEEAEDEGEDDEAEEFEEEDYGDDEEYDDEFEETPWYSVTSGYPSLLLIRLEILRRREQWPEYLRLARATGQGDLYGTMLVQMGRIDEAVEYGLSEPLSRTQALILCRALENAGTGEPALRVAERVIATGEERGLHRAELVVWARNLAQQLGFPERALAAAKTALQEQPNLANYLAAQGLAGDEWPALREATLTRLRAAEKHLYTEERVHIFIHERLVDDAIATVDGYGGHSLTAQVVEAAIPTHPDWVFRTCVREFDQIADRGSAQYYHSAAGWLAHARNALLAAGRTLEWQNYLEGAIGKHYRKYKLRPMLEALRLK